MATTNVNIKLNLAGSDAIKKTFNNVSKSLNTIAKSSKSLGNVFKTINSALAPVKASIAKMTEGLKRAASVVGKQLAKGVRQLGNGFRKLGGLAGGLLKPINLLRGAIVAAVGAFTVGKVIAAASQQEDAINALNTALRITGKFSKEASESFQEYASSLQRSTKFGDEAILETAALIQQLGNLDQKALKGATKATLDLAAGLGVDLTTAANLVGKAAGGMTSVLSRYGIRVTKGATEAETFARALEAIEEKFGGAAQAQVRTFSGALQQTSNTFGDLLEEIGFLITKNPIVITGVIKLGQAFGKIINVIKENSGALKEIATDGFNLFIKAVGGAVRGLLELGVVFLKVSRSVTKFFNSFETKKLIKERNELLEQLLKVPKAEEKALFARIKAIDIALKATRDGNKDEIDSFQKKIDAIEKIQKTVKETVVKVTADPKTLKDSVEKEIEDSPPIDIKVKIKAEDVIEASKDPAKLLFGTGKLNIGEGLGIAAGIANAITSGADGASKLITSGISAGIDTLVPGLGSALSPFIGAFTKGPLAVKNLVKGFLEGIPRIIRNILLSVPAFIETLIEQLPEFIGALVDSIPIVIDAFVSAVPRIIRKLVELAPNIITRLVQSLPLLIDALLIQLSDPTFWVTVASAAASAFVQLIPKIVQGFIDSFKIGGAKAVEPIKKVFDSIKSSFDDIKKAFETIAKVLRNGAKILFNSLKGGAKFVSDALIKGAKLFFEKVIKGGEEFVKKIIENIPGVGGLVSDDGIIGTFTSPVTAVGEKFGFAKGGKVPPGFPNDSFPARLSGGERILRDDVNDKLERFLDGNGGGTSDALMARVVTLLERPVQTTATVELDSRTFAEILLTLSRTNNRVSI